jgi:hypothetical protein
MTDRARMAVVVSDSMDGGTLQALGSACARVHAGIQVWDGVTLPQTDERPAVVVAALAAGARRIPEEILELADRRFPGTQVLLVCDEPLVRPTLTLQRGRLTLIEPPATVERMASRIRLLLADEPGRGEPQSDAAVEPGAPARQELRRAAWWAAQLSSDRPGDVAPAVRPRLVVGRGVSAVLGPGSGDLAEMQIEHALDLLYDEPDGEDATRALERALGPDSGLIHLSDDGKSWLIFWPQPARPLWLFSTQRLPRWSNLAHSAAAMPWRLPAVPGDVIAALSSSAILGEDGDVASPLPSTAVSTAMLDGGPALLALFEARLAAAPRQFACALMEVR